MNRSATYALLSLLMLIAPISFAADAPPSSHGLATVVQMLAKLDDPAAQADVLRGITEALKGRRQVPMPQGWQSLYAKLQGSPSAEVRSEAISLAIVFGDTDAIAALRLRIADAKADPADRLAAIDALFDAHDASLGAILLQSLDDPAIRPIALRDLAAYGEPATPQAILDRYAKLSEAERKDAVNTLASRPAWAVMLLDAVQNKKIPAADVSAFTVRQLSGLKNRDLNARLKQFYGTVRPPAKDKAALISTYKKTFTPDMLGKADLRHGRTVFTKTCPVCHTLFDSGGKVGPELTGSQRANIDYVLENVVDPSAVVAKDYYMTVLETNDGRTITGIIKHEDDKSLSIRDTTQELTLPKSEIKTRQTSPISMMPEGLLEALGVIDSRDLIAYLASPVQVPPKDEKAK